jgi:dienelactone hydrolase
MAPKRLSDFSQPLMEAYARGDFATALEWADKAAAALPGEAHSTLYWRACLLSRLGRADSALDALAEAEGQGHFWSEKALASEDDLEALRGLPRYREIAQRMAARASAAQAASACLTIHAPVPKARAEIVNLHWKGDSAAAYRAYFDASCARLGITAHYVQSSQVMSSKGFSWDDEERAFRDVEGELAGLDTRGLIYCGSSQGGRVAFVEACRHGGDYLGIMPAFRQLPDGSDDYRLQGRAALVIGDRDDFFPRVRELAGYLRDSGLEAKLIVMPGAGHDFPEDFDRYFEEACLFLRPGLGSAS